MATEWINVVDSAVKIGLGALISGVFTYLGLKFKSSSENQRFMLENKAKILEEVSSDIHDYFIAWRFYISIISGITKRKALAGKDGSDFAEKERSSIIERNNDLVDAWPKRESAISKLILLKATNVADAISECGELEAELRSQIIFDKKVPLDAAVKDYSTRVKAQIKVVNNELAKFYSTLNA